MCYSGLEDNSFYCIIGEHESTNSIKINSITSTKIISGCLIEYYNFDIGKIGHNYILICVKDIGYKYVVFSEDLNIIGNLFEYSISDSSHYFLPSIFNLSLDETFITIYYDQSSNGKTKYFYLKSPKCDRPSTPDPASNNYDIKVPILEGIISFQTVLDNKKKN